MFAEELDLSSCPLQDGAYLCNMAVDEKHQRKGYGSLMLAAAEDLVEVADFRRVWLHVRSVLPLDSQFLQARSGCNAIVSKYSQWMSRIKCVADLFRDSRYIILQKIL